MTCNNKTAELFPSIFRKRAALLWTVTVPMAALAAVNAFVCWLTWSELGKTMAVWWLPDGVGVVPRLLLLVFALAALMPAAVAAAVAMWRREPPPWLPVVLGGWCGMIFLAFVFSDWFNWMSGVPEWVVNPLTFLFAQLAGVTPAVFLGIWRLAGWVRRGMVSERRDMLFSFLAMVLPVTLMFFWFHMIGFLMKFGSGSSAFLTFITVVVMVLLFVTMFLGLFRCMMWGRLWLVERMQNDSALKFAYAVMVSLVLPICGLLLNRKIPFPADLQNVWAYALTVVNAVFLMMPQTGRRGVDACTRVGRLVMLPFTCYFFVVFLPFLPFSIPAILAVGAGFLILAPVLLFALHLQALADDRRVAHMAVWRTALCVVALPLAFMARTEFDRLALHRALDVVYQPDYGSDVRLGVPRTAVRRALVSAQRFKTGREYPLLTQWINWRVFDNMLLQDKKLETMWGVFVGGKLPAMKRTGWAQNEFAGLWGGRTQDTTRGTRAPSGDVQIEDIVATHSVTNSEVETRVLIRVYGTKMEEQQEYRTTLTVPPGVWLTGLRLRIDGFWEDGDIIERKAADWVYRQITRVTKRDPAMLRYEDETTLSLKVFPVEWEQFRDVEITFLSPVGFADAVMIGNRKVALGDGTARPMCVWADGVLAKNRLWRAPSGKGEPAADWLVLDCSATNGVWTGEMLAAAAQGMTGTVQVVWANAEIVTEAVPAAEIAQVRAKLRPAGGLNADAALRRVARQCRLSGVARPRVVFAGHSAQQALKKVSSETWRNVLAEMPGLREVRLADGTAFPVPGSVADGNISVLATRDDIWMAVDGQDEVLAFEGAADVPPAVQGEVLGDVLQMPPESRWARGATAWRLQRELDTHPSREGLRREILRASLASDALTAAGAYIVVENDMQRKMLHLKQMQTLGGSGALDLLESPAPDGWLLIMALLALLALRFAPVARKLRQYRMFFTFH